MILQIKEGMQLSCKCCLRLIKIADAAGSNVTLQMTFLAEDGYALSYGLLEAPAICHLWH